MVFNLKCPNCGNENNDSAKFCKKCGTSLSSNKITDKSKNNTKLIIGVLIIIVVIIAATLIYFNGFSNISSDEDEVNVSNSNVENNTPVEEVNKPKIAKVESVSSMDIYGGSFETGSGLSDKTYASIYVGSEHAGEDVKIQILYSRDGNSLNDGNMVLKTVDSSGYINVKSADAYKYYPDYAIINIYNTQGVLLCTQSVSLSPESGTQTF